ncbi:MAG: phospholipase, partial [Sporomusaceae bacterium]|nr:phospholipase [Sporomusaceae bacterium]
AILYLGAAAHLVQDMCVPHHAKCQLFDGHKKYEVWVEKNLQDFSYTQKGEIYIANPVGILFKNAATALDLYSYVSAEASVEQYKKATEVLLPLANQSTVNLFCYFFSRVKKNIGVSSLESFLDASEFPY